MMTLRIVGGWLKGFTKKMNKKKFYEKKENYKTMRKCMCIKRKGSRTAGRRRRRHFERDEKKGQKGAGQIGRSFWGGGIYLAVAERTTCPRIRTSEFSATSARSSAFSRASWICRNLDRFWVATSSASSICLFWTRIFC